MGEPITTSVTVGVVTGVTGATFASLLQSTDAGVFIGALAGAVVYVLSSQQLSRWVKLGYLFASFLIGVLGADLATAIISALASQYLPAGVVVSKHIGATVAAAMGVYILLLLKKINVITLIKRLMAGGDNDNAK